MLLELGPCTSCEPAWRTRHPQLRRAAALAAEALDLAPPRRRPRPVRGSRGLPAVRVACLDEHGIAARSHQPDDVAEAADPAAAERALDLALGIADGIDAELSADPQPAAAA